MVTIVSSGLTVQALSSLFRLPGRLRSKAGQIVSGRCHGYGQIVCHFGADSILSVAFSFISRFGTSFAYLSLSLPLKSLRQRPVRRGSKG